jgi:hypothetical protein
MDTPVDDISTIQVNAVLPSQGAIKDTLTKNMIASSSRLLFSMGRSGIMPTMFSKLHSKYKTPYVAIIFLVNT